MVVMEPDGALRAIVGGRDYGASQFNRATEALRQPGSSFKPYVYLTALMTGKFKPTTIVVDSPVCIGNWCPHNYGDSYAGSLPLANALARSLNTVAVKLSIAIGNGNPKAGRAKIVETARRLGITAPLEDTPSLPIGADEVVLLEHAAAYAAFVNGGKKTLAYTAMEIDNRHGDLLYRHDRDAPPQEQAVPFDKVVELGSMMRKVVEEGTGRAAQLGEGIEVIGKTGTTNGFKDAWFCGYSAVMGGCVWYGNDDGESDEQYDRRFAAGPHMARHHGLRPSGRADQAHRRHGPDARGGSRRERGDADQTAGARRAATPRHAVEGRGGRVGLDRD